jgi:hypothetical protein
VRQNLLTKLEFVRNAKSLNILDGIMETLSSVHQRAVQNGLETYRLNFIPWNIARHQSSERRLYLRLWGSPETLPSFGQTTLIAVETRLKTEIGGLSGDLKDALAASLAENSIKNIQLQDQVVEALLAEDEESETLTSSISEASRDITFKDVVSIARESGKTSKPKDYFVRQIKSRSARVVRFYSELDKLRLRDEFAKIPRTQVTKPEFAVVLAERGNVELERLRSVYSLLMALVLRRPGLQLSEYHALREQFRREFRTIPATAIELKELIELGYVSRITHKYFPIGEYQKTLDAFEPSPSS